MVNKHVYTPSLHDIMEEVQKVRAGGNKEFVYYESIKRELKQINVVYYESIKREQNTRPI